MHREDVEERAAIAPSGSEPDALRDREREVLRARYGLDGADERSLRAVGRALGLSGERVRQIEQRAMGKLEAVAGAGVFRCSGGVDRPPTASDNPKGAAR